MSKDPLGTQKYWPLLTGGRYSEVIYVKKPKLGPQNCGRYRQVVAIRGLTVFLLMKQTNKNRSVLFHLDKNLLS